MLLLLLACAPDPVVQPPIVVATPPTEAPAGPQIVPYPDPDATPAPTVTLTPLPDIGGLDAWDQDLAALRAEVGELTNDQFLARHAVANPPLDHDPNAARYLDDIVKKLNLTAAERARVTTTGLVVTRHPAGSGSHAELYRGIYGRDLPVIITLDSVWFAFQEAYLDALGRIEVGALQPRLLGAIDKMRVALPTFESASKADIDVLLAVARALGTPTEAYDEPPHVPVTVDPANQAESDRLLALALAETDGATQLWGRDRYVAFSRLTPQGRYVYVGDREWWRMVAWLQVARFVLVEDGQPYGGDTRAALALTDLARRAGAARDLQVIEDTLAALVGPAEGVTVGDLLPWRAEHPGQAPREAAIALAAAFGDRNRIRAEQSLATPPQADAPRPMATTFSLFPGRFTLDGHVLTNTTHDRVTDRRYPSPLDVMFTLGSDEAAALLAPELATHVGLGAQLEALRTAQGSLPDAWWRGDVHHRWLDAIRTSNEPDPRRPPAFQGEAGRRRLLQTQLVAWTWLRSDHALYAEESSEEGACSFPDVYVDPYPEVWRAVAELSRHTAATVRKVGKKNSWMASDAKLLDRIAKEADGLAAASESLLTTGHLDDATAEHLRAFIVSPLQYGAFNYSGWYPELFAKGGYLAEPLVETRLFRGTRPAGAPRSLWIRSGSPALMVVTVNTGHGPTAFVGPVGTFATYVGAQTPKEPDPVYNAKLDTDVPGTSPWTEPDWAVGLRAEPEGRWSIPRKDKFTAVEESGDGF